MKETKLLQKLFYPSELWTQKQNKLTQMEKSKSNDIIRVAFYVRVSTDEQAKHGYGVEMQMQALQDMINFKNKHGNWVNKKEWIFIDDGYTGADLQRPEFERMMKAVKNNAFDIIAVWKIDRMSRNLTHLLHVFETLQTHNASFYSLKENVDFTGAIGKLTFQIFGALAEFERETIRARTLEGKIASARMGNWTGAGIPYGYKPVKKKDKGKKKGKSNEKKQIITGIKRDIIKQKDLIKLVNQKFTTIRTFKENQGGEDIIVEIKKTHKI